MIGDLFGITRFRERRAERNGGYGREIMRRIEESKAREAEAAAAGAYAWMRLERIGDNTDSVEGYAFPGELKEPNEVINIDGHAYSVYEYEIRAIKRIGKGAR